MSSLARTSVRLGTIGLVIAIAACSSARSHDQAPLPDAQPLSDQERVAHVLSRLTFGPRPGDAERIAAIGVNRWIDLQLHPERIPDTAITAALRPLIAWNGPPQVMATAVPIPQAIRSTPVATLQRDTSTATRTMLANLTKQVVLYVSIDDHFYAGKIIRAQMSERQLVEVVSDFWENHFSVFSGKTPSSDALVVWDRVALRPQALGKFRDLLGATAHSPEMLYYLDNHLSARTGLNENYARELLELHTLGVNGGYTQQDVSEVARALTGWTFERRRDSTVFLFRDAWHDKGPKTVLGHTMPAGRGIEDGEEVLDILARHPSTARHLAYKLARRFVSDDPPPALVVRAAATFTRTDGDIAEVVRTIVTSPEFFSHAAFRAKVKTPFELVVSTLRALDGRPDSTPATARLIAQLGQPTFGWPTPDGWPERGDAWINTGTLYKRVKFGRDVADGNIASARPNAWRDWTSLSVLPLDAQVDGVVLGVLGGSATPATRRVLAAYRADSTADTPPARLRALLAVALGSPEFQRR